MRDDFCKKVQWHRYVNYEKHFQARALMKSLQDRRVDELAEIINHLAPFPLLNMLGGVSRFWVPPVTAATLYTSCSVRIVHLFNPFYLSDEGWQGFQILWQRLPEPSESDRFPCRSPKVNESPIEYQEQDLKNFLNLPRILKILLIPDPFGAPNTAHKPVNRLGIST